MGALLWHDLADSGEIMSSISLARPIATTPSAFKILFVNTRPIVDLAWCFYLLPLWWVIGVEQFVWPFLLGWAAVKCIDLKNPHLRVPPAFVLLFTFTCFAALSALNIVESYRVIAFVRTYSHYISALCILVIFAHDCREWRDILRVLWAVVTAIGISALLTLTAAAGIIEVNFDSVVGFVLPESIKSTMLGSQIAKRVVGADAWFVYFGRYFRATGFLLFSTYYGAVLMVTIPLMIFLITQTRHLIWKSLLWIFLVAALINLVLTTARVAMIGAAVGAIYFVFAYSFWMQKRRTFEAMILAILLTIMLAVSSFAYFQAEIVEVGEETIESVLYARGTGSVTSRMTVYQLTILGWQEHPFLGWGTERNMVGSTYPAGSHSHYLAMLYKYGLVGFLLFIALCLVVWTITRPPQALKGTGQDIRFLFFGRWIFVALAINSLTTASDVDAILMAVVWTSIGALIAYRNLLVAPAASPEPTMLRETSGSHSRT